MLKTESCMRQGRNNLEILLNSSFALPSGFPQCIAIKICAEPGELYNAMERKERLIIESDCYRTNGDEIADYLVDAHMPTKQFILPCDSIALIRDI